MKVENDFFSIFEFNFFEKYYENENYYDNENYYNDVIFLNNKKINVNTSNDSVDVNFFELFIVVIICHHC